MASHCGSRSIFAVVLLVTIIVTSAEEPVRYDNYHLLRVVPRTELQLRQLTKLQSNYEFDFWIEPREIGRPVDIFVGPENVPVITNLTRAMDLEVEVLMDDAQASIRNTADARDAGDFNWKNYQKIDAITAWMTEQAKKYPQIATIVIAGKSSENRALTGLRIAHKPNQPIVFIEAGVHAREWIAPATATWIIQQVLESKSDLIQSYEWHIFPSVNPDGYAYTQTDRFWRKTRSKAGFFCYGVDANRNWPFQWRGEWFACSETYPGSGPSSEPEIQGLATYLKSIASRAKVYISFHSYSQLLLYPWGYTSEPPSNGKRFHEVAKKAVEKLKERYGTKYEYGPIATTIYQAYGSSVDFAYNLNITYSFAFELRDTGKHGFDLPEDQIIPTAEETFDAVTVILEEAKN